MTTASTAGKVAEAHAHLRARGDIQFELPPPPPAREPGWFNWFGSNINLSWLFWGLIIALGLLLLYMVVRSVAARWQPRETAAEAEREVARWRPEEKAARALLAEADAMADAGRYDEAAHLLLHRSLEEIARRKPRLLRPALTSREIARDDGLPGPVRGAFAAMAAPVERSLFGGRALDRAAWEAARSAYGAFALPGSWA